MALKREPLAEKPRAPDQCPSIFIPKKARCMHPRGHRGMHSSQLTGGGWMDHGLSEREVLAEEVAEAERIGDRAFDELLGKGS